MTPATASGDAEFGPWNPGIQSHVPAHLRHYCTIFRPENVFTNVASAEELRDFTGLEFKDLVAFQPRRLALHEVLIRVTADLSVPDGSRIEDLGVNFRQMTKMLLKRCIEPGMSEIDAIYARLNMLPFDHTFGESFYQPMLADVAHLPNVANVTSPYTHAGAEQISRDGTVAFAISP